MKPMKGERGSSEKAAYNFSTGSYCRGSGGQTQLITYSLRNNSIEAQVRIFACEGVTIQHVVTNVKKSR